MRQLHVVALSTDGRSLLLASAPKGARAAYRIAVDNRLRATLSGEAPGERSSRAGRPAVERHLAVSQDAARTLGIQLFPVEVAGAEALS